MFVADVPMTEVDGELMEELISAESKCSSVLLSCSSNWQAFLLQATDGCVGGVTHFYFFVIEKYVDVSSVTSRTLYMISG